MEASVADAADFARWCHPAAGPAFAEAFTRPAMKTAPLDYASIEEAEAAGWTFNAGLGRWDAPVDLLASWREGINSKSAERLLLLIPSPGRRN